jgi:hypothetical protein
MGAFENRALKHKGGMLSMIRSFVVTFVLVAAVSGALAGGDANFLVNGVTFSLGTGSGSGQCLVTQKQSYAAITCSDGDNWAAGNTRDGCTSIGHLGRCGSGLYFTLSAGDVDVNCPGGNTFTISTNNSQGSGGTTSDQGGNITGGRVDDGKGNVASVNCAANGGKGACGSDRSGSGSCTCKSPCSN